MSDGMPAKKEHPMAIFKNKFGVELGSDGPYIVPLNDRLTPGLLSDSEVDAHIERLKKDLDEVADEAKAEIRKRKNAQLRLVLTSAE
jgi:hypothetical protein